ncbi:MAG: PAS domain S-box protein [Nitrosomonadales bacterium]|nr:PAS domain S-box protein [Nitrosomonadales bacterium]
MQSKTKNSSLEILIAEDSRTQAEQLLFLLEQHGYRVTVANNGKQALQAAQAQKPTLIISDIVMPEMSGYELCKAIKSDERLSDVPVILVTTLSDPQDVIRGLECGADNFIRKPYDERYLLSRINYLLMNLDLRKEHKMQVGVEISLGGQKYFVNSERQQILDLLISTYEQAVHINTELKLRETELEYSNHVLDGFGHIVAGLNHAVTEREAAEVALERAMRLPGIQAGWIFLWDKESGFRLAAARNMPPCLQQEGGMEGSCTCRRRFLSGELDHVTNIMECERLKAAKGDTRGLRYHASVPLWNGSQGIGVMNLVGKEQGLFDEAELKMLYVVGNQVAVALERARLHENLECLVEERTAALRESRESLYNLLDSMFEGAYGVDLNGNCTFVNAAFLKILGYQDADEILGKHTHEIFHHSHADGSSYPESACRMYGAYRTGQPINVADEVFWRKDGVAIPVEYWAHPLVTDGVVTGAIATFIDISQRKQAEGMLRASEEKFRAIFENALDGILLADAETKRFAVGNPAICRMLGYRTEEITGLGVSDIHPQQDLPYVSEQFEKQLRGEIRLAENLPVKRKDGSVFYADVNSAAVTLGDKTYLVGVFRDITQRRESEARIGRLNRIYSVLSGINTTIVRVHDKDELFTEACRITVEHGGFVFSWIGKFDADSQQVTPVAQAGRDDGYLENINLTSRGDMPGSCALTAQALTEAQPVICNDIASDGRMAALRDAALSRGYRSVVVLPITLEDKPIGVFVLYAAETGVFDEEEMQLLVEMSADIGYALDNFAQEARRERAENEARVLTQRLMLATESTVIGIWEWDVKTDQWHATHTFFTMLGYEYQEGFLDRTIWLQRMHPEDRGRAEKSIQAVLAGSEVPFQYEVRMLHADGSYRWINTIGRVAERDQNGKASRIIGVRLDITERKLAEEAIRQLNENLEIKVVARTAELEQARKEADQANQAKSAFLAAMSHEIRTPMNGVIGMIDVLHQSSLKGYQVEMVDLIRESAYSLLSIIDDILDFSKAEAGRIDIENAAMPVDDTVEKVCGMLDHMARKKEVELTLYTDPAIPAMVIGDQLRLRQVLLNLTSNAIKFSSGRQRPGRISVRAVLVEHSPEEVTVEFRVADNGIGMSKETMARLFTPFTQADISTTRNFGGTGLGLAISRHLVTLMGGEISVQSEPGKGSLFTVRLTFGVAHAKSRAGEAPSPVAGLSCLVIGGPDGLAEDIADYLAHDGAAVERAENLTAASTSMPALADGQCIWVVDAAGTAPLPGELRAAVRPGRDARFVVVGRGQRREPRMDHEGMVMVDGNILTRRTILKAVAIAAGRVQEDRKMPLSGRSAAEFMPPSREEALRHGRLILVAEDNETNQQVIRRQLALFGIAADIADNGRIALERWQSGDYALLLTDLHMPEMDGYELTAAVRAAEQGGRHTPIVALTANAYEAEAERCRAAGMDDYLSKPAPLADLQAMLEKWLPAAEPAPLDVSVLKALVGSDLAVICEFLHDFRIGLEKTATELRAACNEGRATQAGTLAHKLKSSARAMGALALGELCAAMEQAGKSGRIEALHELMPRFEAEAAAVNAYIRASWEKQPAGK